MSEANKESAPFNMAALFYYKLAILLEKKDEVALSNDYEGYLRFCKVIWNKVYFQMDEDERKEITKKFDSISAKISGLRTANTRGLVYSNNVKMLFDDLHELDRTMLDYMNNHNMIFPKVEMRAGLAAMEKRYNLDNGKNSTDSK